MGRPRILIVKKIYSDEEIKLREGTWFTESDIKSPIINSNTDVYRLDDNGNKHLLLKFRKNCIPNSLIKKGYELLSLQTFFTSGPEETRAWTITKESTAPNAAGEIHSDFEKGFMRAETISYEDFLNNQGWLKSKEAGKMRLEGKEYIVKDGDILNFRFNT